MSNGVRKKYFKTIRQRICENEELCIYVSKWVKKCYIIYSENLHIFPQPQTIYLRTKLFHASYCLNYN